MKKNARLTLLGAMLALLGFGLAHAAPLNIYSVTTTADDSGNVAQCTGSLPTISCATLRDAITAANAQAAAAGSLIATINFNIPVSDPGCSAGICTLSLLAVLPVTGTGLTLTIDASTSTQSIVISGSSQGAQPIPTPGMIQNYGPLTLNALTIANFSCNSNEEGCTFSTINGYYAPLTVSNSTFVNNSFVNAYGGAILMQNSTLTISNSTFYNNSASNWGGAIDCDGCTMTVVNDTFLDNTTTTAGGNSGAIYITGGGVGTLENTILAGGGSNGNCGTGGPITDTLNDGGGNLSDDNTCNLTLPSSAGGVPDAGAGGLNLGPLASNGGPTQTIALLASSVAISSGVVGNCPATDQRGVARPVSGANPSCSSGAYQFVPVQNGTGTAAGCTAPATCNITGGENQSIGAGTPAAAAALAALTGSAAVITENVCTVNVDPRQICPPGIPSSPYYSSRTLPLAAVCPNLPSGGAGTSVVPDYLCGAYGPSGAGSGTGFGVIQGMASGVNAIPGLLIANDTNPDAFFPPGGNYSSECTPDGVFTDNISDGWGPLLTQSVEGTIPEGNHLIELTSGCGGDKQNTSGMSLTLIGVSLNLANATQELGNLPKTLANFAEFKYVNLGVEVAEDPIDTPNKVRLLEILAQGAAFVAVGKTGCAEYTLYEADRYVINNANHFHGAPALDPNSYGRTRSRILNLFFTLFTRLDGNPNPISPPGYTQNQIINDPLLAPGLSGPPASCSVPYLGTDGY
jgi:hypothetical protein